MPRDLIDHAARPGTHSENGLGTRSDLCATCIAHQVGGQAKRPSTPPKLPQIGVSAGLQSDLGLAAAPPGCQATRVPPR